MRSGTRWNEVAQDTARRLHRDHLFRGDRGFESLGIFEAVTVPRVRATITGKRMDDSPVPGSYIDGRALADGFAETAEFFELDYLDPLEVELGRRFFELVPTLWLAAGGRGERNGVERGAFAVPEGVPYAFLFDASGVRELVSALEDRPDVGTVFIQAASDDAFADLREQLPDRIEALKLYGSYVDHFRRAVR
jgi:adenine-specific DNA-methyltransferase